MTHEFKYVHEYPIALTLIVPFADISKSVSHCTVLYAITVALYADKKLTKMFLKIFIHIQNGI